MFKKVEENKNCHLKKNITKSIKNNLYRVDEKWYYHQDIDFRRVKYLIVTTINCRAADGGRRCKNKRQSFKYFIEIIVRFILFLYCIKPFKYPNNILQYCTMYTNRRICLNQTVEGLKTHFCKGNIWVTILFFTGFWGLLELRTWKSGGIESKMTNSDKQFHKHWEQNLNESKNKT